MSTESNLKDQGSGEVLSGRRPILGAMLSPKSVAVIGASEKPGSVGRALTENIQSFDGWVFLINPSHTTILGQQTFSNILELPEQYSAHRLEPGIHRLEPRMPRG